MKHSFLIALSAFLLAGSIVKAQQTVRIGYVDMEYILENVPEYKEASTQLESNVQKWKKEIETELERIESMKQGLANEKALLTSELIEEREEEIQFEEQKLADYQQKRFGPQGDLMRQKLQLVQPIQDQVFIAVQEIAANRAYDFIFDKSADIVMLYASERFDISDQVIRSITRASKREQLDSRGEKEELLREESKTVEESEVVSEREALKQARQREREELLKERQRERDSLRTAKQKAYEERRLKLIQERERKKDSLEEVRKKKIDN